MTMQYTAEELDDALRGAEQLTEAYAKIQPDAVSTWARWLMIVADRLLENGRKLEQAQAACRSAHSAIVLGNGRNIDWDAIADELNEAIRL